MGENICKYDITPVWIVKHTYIDTDMHEQSELLIVRLRVYKGNKLYRFMFCNPSDTIFDITISSNDLHNTTLFLKNICEALTSQSTRYARYSRFTYNYVTHSAAVIRVKDSNPRYFMYSWDYNKDAGKYELKLREIINGKDVPLKETIVKKRRY